MATLKGVILENVQYDFEDTEARETAQSALTQAETNANDITSAEEKITTAQTTADEAKTAATTAQTTAEAAQTAAQTAQTAAETAQTKAETAQSTAEEKQPFFGQPLVQTLAAQGSAKITLAQIANIFGLSSASDLYNHFFTLAISIGSSNAFTSFLHFSCLVSNTGELEALPSTNVTFTVALQNNTVEASSLSSDASQWMFSPVSLSKSS